MIKNATVSRTCDIGPCTSGCKVSSCLHTIPVEVNENMSNIELTEEEKHIVQDNIKDIEQKLPTGFGNTVPYQPIMSLDRSYSFQMTEAIRWHFRKKGWDIPRAAADNAGWTLAFRGRYKPLP
jgi:hypothetical protein